MLSRDRKTLGRAGFSQGVPSGPEFWARGFTLRPDLG
jgi:hypothetical protein